MKKQLLSLFAALAISTGFAQVPAAAWSTNQNAIFPTTLPNTGVKFMDAVDANVVWVIGKDYAGTGFSRNWNWFSRTTDGGATFVGGNVYSDTNTYILANLEGIDANTAWVSAYNKSTSSQGAIHRTTNGGLNWVNMTAPGMFTNTAAFANWVTFLTPSVGIANGDPVNGEFELWRTTDGGLTWNLTPGANIPNPLAGEFAIVNLYAKVGTSNLWFGTNGNRIFRSTDAGITYSASPIGPVTNTIIEIAFSSPLNGVVYTSNAGTFELWNTYDGGVTWGQVSPLPANVGPTDICQVPGTGYLVSFDGSNATAHVAYSSDNGVTWTDFGSTGIQYPTGDFVDGSTGWAGAIDFTDQASNVFTDVWKFSGALSGTVSPSAAFALPATICLSNATATPVNSSIGSPALSYSWTILPAGATLSSPTASAPTITFASANAYTVILTATSTVGSHSSAAVVNVVACTAPVAAFTLPSTACTGFSFSPTNASTGSPNPGYFWSVSPSNNVTLTPASGAAPAIQVGSAGVYAITLMVTNASGTAQTTQTVNVGPCAPLVDFTIPDFVCLLDGPPSNTFQAFSTPSNPAGATGGSFTYTWTISPNQNVSVLPNFFTQNLTKVTLSNMTPKTYTVTVKVKNPSGTTTLSKTIEAVICTGINETSTLANNLVVFPNPAHEQVNISVPSSSDSYKVKVTNILGSVVFEDKTLKSSKETTTINLAGKAKGVYFLTVESNNEKVTRKIIVE